MAIVITSPTPGRLGFVINAVSADASAAEELLAAPAAGLSIVLDNLTINCGASALSITIGEGASGGAVTTPIIGPVAMAPNTSLQWDFNDGLFRQGIVLTAATSLTVDASGAGAICIFARGRIV